MAHTDSLWFLALYFALFLFIGAFLLVHYRRTRRKSYLWIGILLAAWPLMDLLTERLQDHFTEVTMQGNRPWLFPFSLMIGAGAEMKPWEMSPADFQTRFTAVKAMIALVLLFVAAVPLARSARKSPADPPKPFNPTTP